jgi:hypothetical protein
MSVTIKVPLASVSVSAIFQMVLIPSIVLNDCFNDRVLHLFDVLSSPQPAASVSMVTIVRVVAP